MVENKTTEKQLELSNRIFDKLVDEKKILFDRLDLILNAEAFEFMRDDMSPLEKVDDYLETIRNLKLNSIENRLIQIEGEIEGVKLHIIELEQPVQNTNDSE